MRCLQQNRGGPKLETATLLNPDRKVNAQLWHGKSLPIEPGESSGYVQRHKYVLFAAPKSLGMIATLGEAGAFKHLTATPPPLKHLQVVNRTRPEDHKSVERSALRRQLLQYVIDNAPYHSLVASCLQFPCGSGFPTSFEKGRTQATLRVTQTVVGEEHRGVANGHSSETFSSDVKKMLCPPTAARSNSYLWDVVIRLANPRLCSLAVKRHPPSFTFVFARSHKLRAPVYTLSTLPKTNERSSRRPLPSAGPALKTVNPELTAVPALRGPETGNGRRTAFKRLAPAARLRRPVPLRRRLQWSPAPSTVAPYYLVPPDFQP
ncbi:hypothetical protein V8E36_003577 [Tilletia maclaganii]